MKQALIIGSGFGGLASACLLGKAGYQVTVLEKNEQLGGRAGMFEANGFRFDTGPSWYLMPDVFEHFFRLLGEDLSDHLKLVRLHPNYRVFYKGQGGQLDITGNRSADKATFERIEPGAGKQLDAYLERSEYIYKTSVKQFLYKNYDSLHGFLQPQLLREAKKLHMFSSMDRYVSRYFHDPRLQKIMQYPSVFLGTSPYNAPALYSLLSHVDFDQGVFYPMGGMYELVKSLVRIGEQYGVSYQTDVDVKQIIVENKRAIGVRTDGRDYYADIVISNADLHHTETKLLAPSQRDHSGQYWRSRTLAPSALLLYLGVNRQYDSLLHHNLLFSQNWKTNFTEIFGGHTLPADPSLYVCAPGKTDPGVAPEGHENLFVLVPLRAGLQCSREQVEAYSERILETLEQEMHLTGLRQHLVYKKLFGTQDFATRFNSYQGTGLGLAHTLKQTALFRPSNASKKVSGLYYVGANVSPGIGLPITLISAELLYKRLTGDRSSSPLTRL